LFAMAASRTKPDNLYTYGYKRLEVLAAFTNAVSFQLSILLIHVHAIVTLKFRFLISTIFC